MRSRTRAGLSRRSCSQTLIVRQPDRLRRRPTSRSRERFFWNLRDQNARFVAGIRRHLAHPCQKHPSTKTTSFARANTKSGRPGNFDLCPNFQPLLPARISSERMRHSVDLLPVDRLRPITRDLVTLSKRSTTGSVFGLFARLTDKR
jgi:hypothetical protein